MAMAALFDRMVTDAWTVAFRLPNFFRRLFGEGVIAAGLIPEIEGVEPAKAEQIKQNFYLFLSSLIFIVTLFLYFGASWVLKGLTMSSYQTDVQQWQLTVSMFKIMSLFVFFASQTAFIGACLIAQKRFVAVAFAPVLFNCVMLVTAFLRDSSWLAWGVSLGGLAQMLFLLLVLRPKISLLQNKVYFKAMLRILKKMSASFFWCWFYSVFGFTEFIFC